MRQSLFNLGNIGITVFVLTIALPVVSVCQVTPPVPVPVGETEVRDNNIKMRSNALELMKREAQRRDGAPVEYSKARFAAVKEDFEKIQRLQDVIIKVYKTGKRIDYKRIGGLAAKMTAAAERLNKNLFGQKELAKLKKISVKRSETAKTIVDLDGAIGRFVSSKVFANKDVVDSKASRKAQRRLFRIMELSSGLQTVATPAIR